MRKSPNAQGPGTAGRPQLPPGWTANDVRRWLLKLFRSGYSELPDLSDHIAAPVAVQSLFDSSTADAQEVLKAGTILALREWRLAAHGYSTLEQLSQSAALLRATGAVPQLCEIARRQLHGEQSEARLRALSTVVACLCGFGPAADVEAALRLLFFDRSTEPAIAGQLFVGLCRCRPHAYPSVVPRFLELRERVPGRFDRIGRAFLAAVPPATLIEHFEELDRSAREGLDTLLRTVPDSSLLFTLTDKGIELSWSDLPKSAAIVATGKGGETGTFSSHMRDTLATHFSGPDINLDLQRLLGTRQ